MNTETIIDGARFLNQNGIDSGAHHATIKKEFKAATGQALDKDTLASVREAMAGFEAAAELKAAGAVEPDPKFNPAEVYGDTWNKVAEITEYGTSGRPTRVLINCQDPQVNGKGESVCEHTRYIAVQDLFQVNRCHACQKRAVAIYRNQLAKAKRAAAKKAAPKKAPAKKGKK